jgi:hypothetical protein
MLNEALLKKHPGMEKCCMASDMDCFFGMTQAREHGSEIWNFKCQESMGHIHCKQNQEN